MALPWLVLFAAIISGHVTDPSGRPVSGATVDIAGGPKTTTPADGSFVLEVPGKCTVHVYAAGFRDIQQLVSDGNVELRFTTLAPRSESITVGANSAPSILNPDPGERSWSGGELLATNGPGAPVSIPGLPIESASGGIKAPQYFAPGVAGDHGEPIATYFAVGSYLIPNNLSANAHGNGYSDPNPIIAAAIESVQVDGGAFNVREGNHSVDLAETWEFRGSLTPFVAVTGDYRDFDVAAGWSLTPRAWIAIEAAWGDGLLRTPEHRRQYKVNGYREWEIGRHQLTLFALGYYGASKIPGLVPIGVSGLDDTIDPRQRDQTHTAELAVNDSWRIGAASEMHLSGFFRTYNLALDSNFGDGLIRQSEFRTVAGGNAMYVHRFSGALSLLAGIDTLRDAPRRLDLDRYDPFRTITANNVTLSFLTPFVALDGQPVSWLHYDLGWRRDEIDVANSDLLHPANSSQAWVGVNSPKATITLAAPETLPLPVVSFSFGQSFFTNDPRIGNGFAEGTRVSRAQGYQIAASRTILGTDLRVIAGRSTQEQSLAKIDPDTGLQYDQGPGRNRFVTLAARRYFHGGSLQASVSKADARDLLSRLPVPEAPRLIVDVLGTLDRLPFRLQARAEYEEVGRRPLGDGFVSVPVREFRGSLVRTFRAGHMEAGLNFGIASGYSGQTTEGLALSGEAAAFERIVGVYLPSYVTVSYKWRIGR